jgi:carboxypeptidase PM20D1
MKTAFKICGILMVVLLGVLSFRAAGTVRNQSAVPSEKLKQVDAYTAASRLSRAIQFKTVSNFDRSDFPDAEFESFHQYLQNTYPRVHTTLQKELIAGRTLLYTWQGSKQDIGPVLLMGHQDVVPVDPQNEKSWTYLPFEGRIDGGFVWGRGTLDDKVNVIGVMEALETLVSAGFHPARTIYILFGHDEEAGGSGAAAASEYFRSHNIKFDSVLDEGSVIFDETFAGVKGSKALIGIAEKGFLNLELSVNSEGGHSSMPPRETAVGILSNAIVKLQENPLPARLDGPAGQMIQQLSPYMSFGGRLIVRNLWLFEPLMISQMGKQPSTNAMIRTTTAPTILKGGFKDNVLATSASAVVNFRIIPGDTVESVTAFVTRTIGDQRVNVKKLMSSNPSPVSDISSEPYQTLSKTIHEVYPETILLPSLVVGATDSRHFTKLTQNVYRFTPAILRSNDLPRVHGINERISVQDFSRSVQFYIQYLKNVGV